MSSRLYVGGKRKRKDKPERNSGLELKA